MMKTTTNSSPLALSDKGIPESLAPCFQEYVFDTLDLERDHDLIIERALAYGNRDEVRWLIDRFGHGDVADWVAQEGQRRLTRHRYRLWAVLLIGEEPDSKSESRSNWPH
jgi:hypothetical protein